MDSKSKKMLQFLNTFEVMIKCPVCDNKLRGNIYLCGSGHSICNFCHDKGSQCKKCNAPYTKMQNLLLHDLILKYDGLKVSLDEINKSEMQQLKPDKVSELISPGKSVNSNDGKLKRNKYRCLITDNCEFIGCLGGIIEHFEKIHPLEFQQHSNKSLPYKNNWQMNYFIGNNLNRAFNIANYGLFILHISRNINEQLKACILMYSRNSIANQHSYRIEIECDEKKLSYNGKVESARTLKQIIFGSEHKCLLIEPNKPLYKALKDKVQFKCSITLKKDNLSGDVNTNSKINEGVINNQPSDVVNLQKTPDQDNKSKEKTDADKKSTDLNIGGCKKKVNQQKKNKSSNKQPAELNNNQKNQGKIIDKSLNKQLTGSKLNLYQPAHQLDGKNEQKQLQNKLNSFTKSPEVIYQPPYNNYGQFPPQSNQIYQNYGPYGMNTPRPLMNFMPPPLGYDQMSYQSNANVYKPPPMINCHYNNASAPEVYERQQPINPHYQHQQMMNSNDNPKIKEKSKDEVDKCVAF